MSLTPQSLDARFLPRRRFAWFKNAVLLRLVCLPSHRSIFFPNDDQREEKGFVRVSDPNDDGQSRRVEIEDDGRRTMKYNKNEEGCDG